MAVARVLLFVIAAVLWIGLAGAQPQNEQQTSAPPTVPNAGTPPTVPNAGTPPTAPNGPAPASPAVPSRPPTPDDICRALEQDAAENEIPVEFFARVIWQESRFNARAVSNKGAQGIAQFMPATSDYRGLVDPFDPIEALEHSARYLRDLKARFGNLGLAAAAYNAGPGRVSAWLNNHRPLPGETRNYVAIITGWTADEWASPNPPKTSETTIPQGVPCTRLANLILAPKEQAQRMAAYVPRWGMQLSDQLGGEQGLGDLPDDPETICRLDRRSRTDRDKEPRHRTGLRHALQHPHRRRRSRIS